MAGLVRESDGRRVKKRREKMDRSSETAGREPGWN
jgi:hypothetical protein